MYTIFVVHAMHPAHVVQPARVKTFLKKAWNARGRVAEAIDSVLGTSSAIFAAPVC